MPCLREEVLFDRLELERERAGLDETGIPRFVVGPGLGAGLSILPPGHVEPVLVTWDLLEQWKVRFAAALQAALGNLLNLSQEALKPVAPGVYRSRWSDGQDAARLTLPEVFRSLDLEGEPVVMVPTGGTLLVAGSEDPEGLDAMAALAEEAWALSAAAAADSGADSDRLSLISLRPRDGVPSGLLGEHFCHPCPPWVPFFPPGEQTDLLRRLSLLRYRTLARDYAQQRGVLLDQAEQRDERWTVAPYVHALLRRKQCGCLEAWYSYDERAATPDGPVPDGKVMSASVWVDGEETLLPNVGTVVLFRPDPTSGKPESLGTVDLATLLQSLDRFYPQDLDPPRFLVRGFPTQDVLDRIVTPGTLELPCLEPGFDPAAQAA